MSSLPSVNSLLEEPPPLGLKLTKSPSFIASIEATLSQENNTNLPTESVQNDHRSLKASNFPVSLLRIGTWECISKYEGDLVTKCYYAKNKLVWEILDGLLKNKIEIQWSNIVAIKANYPEHGPGTLDVVLAKRPQFFRETGPEPRKHTLWQQTLDFTGGQASIHRRHFLQCPEGVLGRHFEKIIQCDPRLKLLSQQPEISLDDPYFEPHASKLAATNRSICRRALPSGISSGLENERQNYPPKPTENNPNEVPSRISVADMSAGTEGFNLLGHCDQIPMSKGHPSEEMNDLVHVIGNSMSEQISSGNHVDTDTPKDEHKISDDFPSHVSGGGMSLEEDGEQLYNLPRVASPPNFLSSIAEESNTAVAQNLESKAKFIADAQNDENNKNMSITESADSSASEGEISYDFSSEGKSSPVSDGGNQDDTMWGEESVGELLHNLPRVASLPHLLIDITKESDDPKK